MATAATGLAFTAFYSKGDWDGYAKVKWTENDVNLCIYRVEYQLISDSSWVWLIDAPVGAGVIGVDVPFAHADPGEAHAKVVSNVRITCIRIPTDGSPAVTTIATPTLTPSHVLATGIVVRCYGAIGDANGRVDLEWLDTSQFIRSGEVILSKFGVTSPTTKQIEYQETYLGTPKGRKMGRGESDDAPGKGVSPEGKIGSPLPGRANFISIPLKLIPPGLPMPKAPPFFSETDPPPSLHAAFPKWVVDGDILTLQLTTLADGDTVAKVSFFTFPFYRELKIIPFSESATAGTAFSKQIQIQTDQFTTTAGVTFACTGLPAGLTCSSSGLISGTPTTAGTYTITITATSLAQVLATATSTIVVVVSTVPQITAPPATVTLKLLFPVVNLAVRATNHPTSFAITTGSLPVGTTLNTTTGAITGTPTAIESPHNVVFTATNAAGTSPTYTVSFEVVPSATPIINSAATLDAFIGESVNYAILTNIPAQAYEADGLPDGLELIGNSITGTPNDDVGVYVVTLRAQNRIGWGSDFILTITLALHAPVISSLPTAIAYLTKSFSYQIAASNSPTKYGASGLPAGITVNPNNGLISGIPTALGIYSVGLLASNAGGTGSLTLILTVALPPRPVIDVAATQGKAITTETGVQFLFQPAASNDPTSWRATPIPDGLNLDLVKGTLSGIFKLPGLIGIVFVATNLGGDSDPVTFYFLVELGKELSIEANIAPVEVNIWVDLINGKTSLNVPTGGPQGIVVKRGDTSIVNILFHQAGIPADLVPTSLKFGAKPTYEDDYVVYTEQFLKIGAGAFTIYPDFSQNNEDLDSILVTNSIKMIGEIQWESPAPPESLVAEGVQPPTFSGPLIAVDTITRRSTQQFDVTVLRDVIHPD